MTRDEALAALVEIANEQGGYVTSRQAGLLGVEPTQLSRLARTGDVRRVRWGVYAMRHANHYLEAEIAAWLSIDRARLPWERGDDLIACFSHESAASMENLGTIVPRLPTLTVPPVHRSATRSREIDLHVAELSDGDWRWLPSDGVRLPVTTAARTIIDLLQVRVEPSYVERAAREALAGGLTTSRDMLRTAESRKRRSMALQRSVERLIEATER